MDGPISQTEKSVEREQIRSNEQVLPTPAIDDLKKKVEIGETV
jgi:hypothetical protein